MLNHYQSGNQRFRLEIFQRNKYLVLQFLADKFNSRFNYKQPLNFRSEPPPVSPRHVTSRHSSETLPSLQLSSNSVILRDSSIRETSIASSLEDNISINARVNANRPINVYNNARPEDNTGSFQMGSRDSTSSIFRDPSVNSSFSDSTRFLINGIDQRILKQSSEDCRRLLQQVSCLNATQRVYSF